MTTVIVKIHYLSAYLFDLVLFATLTAVFTKSNVRKNDKTELRIMWLKYNKHKKRLPKEV